MSGKATTSEKLFTKYIRTKRSVNDVAGSFHRLREAQKDFGWEQPRVRDILVEKWRGHRGFN